MSWSTSRPPLPLDGATDHSQRAVEQMAATAAEGVDFGAESQPNGDTFENMATIGFHCFDIRWNSFPLQKRLCGSKNVHVAHWHSGEKWVKFRFWGGLSL